MTTRLPKVFHRGKDMTARSHIPSLETYGQRLVGVEDPRRAETAALTIELPDGLEFRDFIIGWKEFTEQKYAHPLDLALQTWL